MYPQALCEFLWKFKVSMMINYNVLGGSYNATEAKSAGQFSLKVSRLKSFNLDLMHSLPNQTLEEA